MLDIKRIREDFDGVKKAVESRGKGDFGIDKVREYDVERRKLLAEVEQMQKRPFEAISKDIAKETMFLFLIN